MPLKEWMDVNIYEKDEIEVDFVEKDLITVDLYVIDIIEDRGWVADTIKSTFITNETPTKVNATDFTTEFNFVTGSLQVFYNGLKEKNITEIENQKFRFPYNTIIGDIIEISYIRMV